MLTEIVVSSLTRADIPPLSLPLFEDSRFPVNFIDGLGPVKADVSSGRYANRKKGYISGSTIGERNIVLTLELNPSYFDGESMESLRTELYRLAPPDGEVSLVFVTDGGRQLRTQGRVETSDTPLFVQSPMVQISILCPDPFMHGETKSQTFGRTSNAFMEVTVEGQEVTEFALTTATFTASTGYELLVEGGGKSQIFSCAGPFPSGRQLLINTEVGGKIFEMNNQSMIHNMTASSSWPVLYPGLNTLRVRLSGGDLTVQNNHTLVFTERYIGL